VFWIFLDSGARPSRQVTIEGPEGHHLARVLRVRVGEEGVVVSAGRQYEVKVSEVRQSTITAEIVGDRPISNEPAVDVTLLQSVLPNPDFDAVIEAGTAVGIRRFVAVQADRSVARPSHDRLLRWKSIARSAAEQSHRGQVPSVIGPVKLEAALTNDASGRLIVLEPMAPKTLAQAINGSDRYTLAVGPEGGWTDDELQRMRERQAVLVNLGPRILRARLAPVVAAAILVQRS
jgi:16S rRNA (uracil1498-N3)-methyltransferase